MRFLALFVVTATVAACAGSTKDAATGDEQDLSLARFDCKDGSTTFAVAPEWGGIATGGTLVLGGTTSVFLCDPGAGAIELSCNQRTEVGAAPTFRVDVTKTDGKRAATIVEDGKPPVTIACDPDVPDTTPVPSYAQVAPLLETCNGCHDGAFATLAKVRASKNGMLGMITTGSMPRGNPGWRTTDDGKKVIAFLERSPELQ